MRSVAGAGESPSDLTAQARIRDAALVRDSKRAATGVAGAYPLMLRDGSGA